jgi:hypothetical protein
MASMEDTEDQIENSKDQKMGGGASNFKPWLFQPGKSGNPGGRPPGPSMKTWFKNYLATLDEEQRMEFVKGMPKDILWRMAEGQPHQTNEHDVKANMIVQFHSAFNDKHADTPQAPTGSNPVEGTV